MDTVAYIYFKTPPKEYVKNLFQSIISSGINISHFSRNDPPRKCNGNIEDMNKELFKVEAEINKWCFLKDIKQKIELDIHLTFDEQWSFSEISIGGKNELNIVKTATSLAQKINAYLCIQGASGKGKDQEWNLLYECKSCPEEIKDGINFA